MENEKELSKERKKKYKAGSVLMFLGGLLFLSYFLDVIFFNIFSIRDARSAFNEVRNMWLRAFIGVILLILGGMKKARARTGLMKPNTNMDLEQNMEERKHLRKLKGKQLNDTLSEINLSKHLGIDVAPVIKIRCQDCRHLNDEEDKFCGGCGQKI
ncbi:MAG: hypothetical protein AB8E82_20370 [Aureispira sp.]